MDYASAHLIQLNVGDIATNIIKSVRENPCWKVRSLCVLTSNINKRIILEITAATNSVFILKRLELSQI